MVFTWDRSRKSTEFGGRRRGRGRSHLRTGNRKIAIDLWEDKLRSSFTQFFWVCFFFPCRVLTTIPEKSTQDTWAGSYLPLPLINVGNVAFCIFGTKSERRELVWCPNSSARDCRMTWIVQLIFPSSLYGKLEIKNLVGCERRARVFRSAGKRYRTEKIRKTCSLNRSLIAGDVTETSPIVFYRFSFLMYQKSR